MTAQAALLPLAVVFPIVGAVAAPLLARVSRRLPVYAAIVALGASAVVLLTLARQVFSGRLLSHFMGNWTPVRNHALGIAFVADPFGMVFALVSVFIGGLLLVYTLSELGGLGARELGGYAALFQLLLAALIGVALTGDLFNLFVWFEVAALSSYGLTGFFLERPIALEATFKLLVLTTIASFSIFIATGLLYAQHGALNFGELHAALGGRLRTADVVALGLLIAGYATKAGLVPFHGWLADAHTAAPGPVSALFSGLMVNLGIVAIARLTLQVYGPSTSPILGVLMVVGLVSAVLGAVLALAQDDLKRLLAYDTVSQMGVLVVGLATGSGAGVAGAAYHLLNHALFKSLLFLCAGAIVHRTGVSLLSEMGRLARHMPGVAAAFVVGAVSIAGLPPLNGYVSLSLIHQGLAQTHQPVPYVVLVVAQLITVAALAKAGWLAFVRRRPDDYQWRARLRPGMAAGLTGLGVCCVAFGALPRLVLDRVIGPAAGALLDAGAYSRAALGQTARSTSPHIPFTYFAGTELAVTGLSILLGGLLVTGYLRSREPFPVRLLRSAHNGSVNDYAAYAVAGTVLVVTLLALA